MYLGSTRRLLVQVVQQITLPVDKYISVAPFQTSFFERIQQFNKYMKKYISNYEHISILNGYWYHGYKYNNRKHKNAAGQDSYLLWSRGQRFFSYTLKHRQKYNLILNVTYISLYLPQIYYCQTCLCNSPQSHFLHLFFFSSVRGIVSHKVYFSP